MKQRKQDLVQDMAMSADTKGRHPMPQNNRAKTLFKYREQNIESSSISPI